MSEEIRAAGVLSFQEIAQTLGIDERILRRIRKQVAKSGGEAPRPRSRRPHHSPGELSEEIQRLIRKIERSADTRRPYGPTDVKRILEKNYKKELLEHHGQEEIALSTVAKYLGRKETEATEEHPRGSYVYPEPFQEVAIDTSYFKAFGLTFCLRFRLVCPPATPTAKAAAERHFGSLKQILHPALEKVFPRDPGWEPDRLVKLLEMGESFGPAGSS